MYNYILEQCVCSVRVTISERPIVDLHTVQKQLDNGAFVCVGFSGMSLRKCKEEYSEEDVSIYHHETKPLKRILLGHIRLPTFNMQPGDRASHKSQRIT